MSKKRSFNQLIQLTSAHFKETIREPGVLFWGIVFPILMSLGLGIAFTKKQDTERKVAMIEQPHSAVLDSTMLSGFYTIQSSTSDSAAYSLIIKNKKLGNTTIHFYKMDRNEAILALKRGKINVFLEEKDGHIAYSFDPVNPDAQLTYLKLSRVFGKGENLMDENDQNIDPLTITGTRYIDFLIPGLLAMGLMMSSMWGLSYGMIEKRSKKLLRRMVATPMKKSYFLISWITVRMAMNFIESVLLIIFAVLVFNITIEGSIPALLLIFIAANIAFAGLAIFISCRTAKTEIGNGLINVVVMPMMLLSGVFFSYHNFPDKLIPIIQKLPLTMVADGMRSIFIEGAGFPQIMEPVIVLTTGGIVFFALGLKFFRWY
jgi:ABC-2 type transport system permease protein